MSLVIHAGLKKCGSTSIHEFLSSNRSVLWPIQIDYPGPDRPGTDLAREYRWCKTFDSSTRTLARLAKSHAARPDRTMVISSEMLEIAPAKKIECIRQAFVLADRPVNISIIFVIRNLSGLLPSIYAQKVRIGKTSGNFDTFFEETIDDPRLQFFQTASRWAQIFGWNNLKIRILERDALLNGDLFDDFLSLLGCTPACIAGLPLKRPDSCNVAPGWRVVEALRALRSDTHGLPQKHPLSQFGARGASVSSLGGTAARIGEQYGWNRERGHYLTRRQTDICRQIYATNLEALNRRLPGTLSLSPNPVGTDFGEREYMPAAAHIPADQLRAFYDDLAAAYLATESRRPELKSSLPIE